MYFLNKNKIEYFNKLTTKIKKKINISFEFFPPNNNEIQNIFYNSINKLKILKPKFFSITQKTNSNKNNINFNIIKKIKKITNIEIVPHLTCINTTHDELKIIAENYWLSGIKHIIALRGDIQKSLKTNNMYAVDLVYLLKKKNNFKISVAAYPEKHPEAITPQFDLINLKKKIDAGADNAITQFFFDIDKYLRFRDNCFSIGIKKEIIPGILPIINFNQIKKFIKITNIKIPNWILKKIINVEKKTETSKIVGISIIVDMIKILIKEGVKNLHFYTLNNFNITHNICNLLEIKK